MMKHNKGKKDGAREEPHPFSFWLTLS